MSRLDAAKIELTKVYNDTGLQLVLEAMDIVNKYAGSTTEDLSKWGLDELQADAIKLTALNFYLGATGANLSSEASRRTNMRKYKEASNWTNIKKNNPSLKLGEVDKQAEEAIHIYRSEETEAFRKADIMKVACDSIVEVVNMIKKIVERIMWQGPSGKI